MYEPLQPDSQHFSVFAKIDRLAFALERSRTWPLAIFLAAYLPLTVLIARHKLIWDDEFFTLYLSRPSSLSGILKALKTGADQHPPLFYFLTHLVTATLGTSHLTLRLVPIFGYGLFCICLFFLLRNRTSVLWAMVGMFLPLVTSAYYYASEARGYSLMLGFCSLALLSWQNAAVAHKRRPVWLCLLFGGLVMAVASHYYAILFLIPLCIGELTRTYLLKRIEVPIWLSFCGAGVSPVVFFSTIREANQYSAHFWATPYWSRVLQFYPAFLGSAATVLLLGALVVLLDRSHAVQDCVNDPESASGSSFFVWEVLAWISIAALPIFTMFLAKLITHGYIERYALPALIGAVLIICHTGFHVVRRSRITPFLLSLVFLIFFGVSSALALRAESRFSSDLVDEMTFLAQHRAQPIALLNITVFHQVSFYAPRQLVQSFAYICDPAHSVEYLQQDTVDRGLLDLRPWFPLNIVEYTQYVKEHSQFLAYGSADAWNWLTYTATPPTYTTELLDRLGDRLLLRVQRAAPPLEPPPPGRHRDDSEYLFNHVRATGPSLCEEWFPGDSFCTSIEQKRQRTTLEDALKNRRVRR